MRLMTAVSAAMILVAGCKKAAPAPVYETIPVDRRDIIVSAHATGTIQADTTVEVKTRASGEVLQLKVETGQVVKRNTLMMQIDPRLTRNAVAQSEAALEAARVQLHNAEIQKGRSDSLLATQAITVQEHDQDVLTYANAKAGVVSAEVALENNRINLQDADVRAPITGTIIEIDVSRGNVIASATSNVGGGTTLLKMADLNLVQVSTPIDETDIGKIQPGQRASVTVDAYPNHPFQGTVLKIEPKDTVQQNVTMFPVRIRIDNRDGLLRPGMNADVEIHVGQARQVLAVPSAALRTQRDVASAAQVLGLDPQAVQAEVREQLQQGSDTASAIQLGGRAAGAAPAGGRRSRRVAGDSTGQAGVGQAGTASNDTSARVARRRALDALTGGRWIVFVQRGGKPAPTWVRTGLTDLDYSEVLDGLSLGDSVYILPSASLVQSQQQFRQRITNLTGGGGLPGMRQQQQGGTGGGAGGTGAAGGGGGAPRQRQ
jgi:HlyD family secretion protein